MILKETILKNGENAVNNLLLGKDGVSVSNISTAGLIAYGKLSAAVMFYSDETDYMIQYIMDRTLELEYEVTSNKDYHKRETV